ncbi:MAG: hypothetical protein FJ318_00275 [SAR202 cluster bacterium]|nr:hypothetical protein [SAR202 cluster bacterium]
MTGSNNQDLRGDLREREIQNLREAYDGLRRRFTLLAGLSRRMSATLDPQAVVPQVVEAACQLTNAKYGALVIFGPDGRIREFMTHGISAEDRAKIGNLPEGLGLLGLLQHLQQPIRVADLTKHPHSVGFPPNHPPM